MSPKTNGHFHLVPVLSLGPGGGTPPRAGMREGSGWLLPLTSTINFFCLLPRYQLKVSDCAELGIQELIDCSFAGSVSCLVTPPQSNYHRGMHNGLINN